MMRSSMNTNNLSYDDDEDFAPNPFRTSNSSDLLDNAPRNAPQFQDPFQPQMYAQQPQQQQQPMMHPQPIQSNPTNSTGMPAGVLNYPQPQPLPPTQHPGQYLSDQMDTGARTDQARLAPPPQGMFGWLLSCVRLDQVTKLFDVDADDVALRLQFSLTQFFRPDHFRTTVLGNGIATDTSTTTTAGGGGKGPDLYGPFWISMTLIFVLGVASNLSDYLHYQRKSDNPDSQFEYDITHVLHAMYIVFCFSFGVPTCLWITSTFCMGLSGSVQWDMWVCCYGYSMAPIMAGALVAWWLPFWIWHFMAMAAGVGASCLLVLRNLSTPFLTHEDNHAKAAPLLLAMLGIHITYLLVLMWTFFPRK